MVSAETLISYPDWKLTFTFHTDASDKQLGYVISQNNKQIAFYSIILSNPHHNYTTTVKELLAIVECLKQFRGIIFGYEINVFSDHTNLVYDATLSEYQRVIRWRLILEEFGTNIHHISGFGNILADTISRFPSAPSDKYKSCTRKSQCRKNKLFALGRIEKKDDCFTINILIVKREKQR